MKLKSFADLNQLPKNELLRYITDLHDSIRFTEGKIRDLALDVKYKKN